MIIRPRYSASSELCRTVRQLAPPHIAKSNAPVSLGQVSRQAYTGVYVVWNGASELAIWDAETNFAFRALHDMFHVRLGAEFDSSGESAVADATDGFMRTYASHLREEDFLVLRIEVTGQLEYCIKHGKFPNDQAAFTAAAIEYGVDVACNRTY